jgi:hypothetical protein
MFKSIFSGWQAIYRHRKLSENVYEKERCFLNDDQCLGLGYAKVIKRQD